jgi:DNA (cytosine-5)-methyltransferase 1
VTSGQPPAHAPDPPRIGSLCTGYGGLDLAAETVLGGHLAWYAETCPRASTVLAARFPNIPNLGDIRAVDWTRVEPVDVLTAGFPCQDISNAGKRAGITGPQSSLWTAVAAAIRDLQPPLALVENVAALLRRGLDRVHADLATLGYDTRWTCLRAADIGAPHRRDRLFLLATRRPDHGSADLADTVRPWRQRTRAPTRPPRPLRIQPRVAPDPDSSGRAFGGQRHRRPHTAERGPCRPDVDRRRAAPADTTGDRRHERLPWPTRLCR